MLRESSVLHRELANEKYFLPARECSQLLNAGVILKEMTRPPPQGTPQGTHELDLFEVSTRLLVRMKDVVGLTWRQQEKKALNRR